jgi:hypothetical protein
MAEKNNLDNIIKDKHSSKDIFISGLDKENKFFDYSGHLNPPYVILQKMLKIDDIYNKKIPSPEDLLISQLGQKKYYKICKPQYF